MRICATNLARLAVLALGLVPVGCGGKNDEKADLKTDAKADEKAAEDSAGPVPPTTALGEGGEQPPEASETGAAEAEAAEEGAEETGAQANAGETGAAVAPEEQIKALLTEVANKKTKDDRAVAALEEAKALGSAPKELATAANKRGEKLLTSSAERATIFFEWAQAADPKYPNATFNLAKLAANTGEIDRVKELLTAVKERGGKKLLQQIEFDPSFALVADDPEVLSLLR